jgi:hypothetical protein
MVNGKWKMENGLMENGEWKMENGARTGGFSRRRWHVLRLKP